MTLSMGTDVWFLQAGHISHRSYPGESIVDQNVYEIFFSAGFTEAQPIKGVLLVNVSSSARIGGDDKDLIPRMNLAGRITHESHSIDVAGESGRQTHPI